MLVVARDTPVVAALPVPEGMVGVSVSDGTVVAVASEGTAAIVVSERTAAVVAALARPGMPAGLLSELALPSLPAAPPVVGHPGSTGCWLDMLMEARTCADEAKTISAATPATVILFIVRPRVDDVPHCNAESSSDVMAITNCGLWADLHQALTLAVVPYVTVGTSAMPATD